MSLAGLIIDQEMNHNKKSFHRRNDSGELDVFEASRYFSGYNEVIGYTNNSTCTQKVIREERNGHRGRISLDMPMRTLLPQQFNGVDQKQIKDKKHNKQPSSPGGRLASFLNSLFNQSTSKKKKSKSSSQSMKDEDESPGAGRRMQRCSISHFRSSSTADSKSVYSSLSSGFRTPPYVNTPTKGCREFKTLSELNHAVKTNLNVHVKPSSTTLQNELGWDDKKRRNSSLLGDNYKQLVDKREIRKFNEVDDGAESDSSSDLFELQNYDLCHNSSGLPVYETTNMDNIKRGSTISNVSH
ncbi:unnamed protein product [Lathyrus sativus]|nr:unnamed protein product [Lathyrus sativus]